MHGPPSLMNEFSDAWFRDSLEFDVYSEVYMHDFMYIQKYMHDLMYIQKYMHDVYRRALHLHASNI